MSTIASTSLPLTGLLAILRRSWLVAGVDAIGGALAALLLGPSSVDAAVGFRR